MSSTAHTPVRSTVGDAPSIVVSGVSKTFRQGSIRAVTNVDLSIHTGEIVALLGANGAGKTTLMDMIVGLTQPTQGTINVQGTTARAAITQARTGAMLQSGGLLPDITVRDTIRMIAATYPDPLPVDRVMEQANLTGIAERKVKACSGGEQQRIKFGLALLSAPNLLVLDEPTAGMDPSARRAFWASMRTQAESGTTFLFATHYLEEAAGFATRIIMMAHGRVVADGPVEEIQALSHTGRIQVTIPGGDATGLPEIPGLQSQDWEGERLSLTTAHPDDAARTLLNQTAAHDLRITPGTLDDAFDLLSRQEEQV